MYDFVQMKAIIMSIWAIADNCITYFSNGMILQKFNNAFLAEIGLLYGGTLSIKLLDLFIIYFYFVPTENFWLMPSSQWE